MITPENCYLMKNKYEIFKIFKQWKAEVENQTRRKIKYLTNNGTNYTMEEFLEYYKNKGISRNFTVKKLHSEISCRKNE